APAGPEEIVVVIEARISRQIRRPDIHTQGRATAVHVKMSPAPEGRLAFHRNQRGDKAVRIARGPTVGRDVQAHLGVEFDKRRRVRDWDETSVGGIERKVAGALGRLLLVVKGIARDDLAGSRSHLDGWGDKFNAFRLGWCGWVGGGWRRSLLFL